MLPTARKFNFSIHLEIEKKKEQPKPRFYQKLRKKSNFSMPFQLGFEKEKATAKTKTSYQTLESLIFQFFFNWNLKRKKQQPKPRFYQKLENSNFSILFNWNSNRKRQDSTKKLKNFNFQYLFKIFHRELQCLSRFGVRMRRVFLSCLHHWILIYCKYAVVLGMGKLHQVRMPFQKFPQVNFYQAR